MLFHVHATSAEAHAFGFQAQSLFDGVIASQLDFAASSEYALPRQSKRTVQHTGNLPGAIGESRGASNGAVGRHFSSGNFLNGRANSSLRPRCLRNL
jgi:hypothetical protein